MQSTPYVCMAHMQNLHLMTPQGHLVHLAMVYGQFLHLCGNIIIFQNKFPYFFYLTILELLDITSQRKLAHIQRFILLNYYFNSITDTPVGTFSLTICNQSVLLVSKLILFYFYIFPDTVVSIRLGKVPTLGSRTKIYHYTTHTWTRTTIFGILNRIATVVKSNQIHVFSSFRQIM